MPVITSQSCTFDSSGGVIALVDTTSVCVADVGITVARSTQGFVEADDDPQGNVFTPAGDSAQPVSLFQNDLVALMVTRYINWLVARTNSVVTVTDCLYEGS